MDLKSNSNGYSEKYRDTCSELVNRARKIRVLQLDGCDFAISSWSCG